MFVSILSFRRVVSHDDPLYAAHRAFLEEQVAASKVLCSGPRVGADGGVVIAYGSDEQQARALLDRDPYVSEGLASYELIEFKVGLCDPASTLAGS